MRVSGLLSGLILAAGMMQAGCGSRPQCLDYDGSCSPLMTLLLFDRTAKYIFVTTTGANAAYGGVTGADTYCSSGKPSALPGSGSDYKALLLSATRNQSTGWVLRAGYEYRRSDGLLVGRTNASRVFVFPLTNPVQDTGIDIRTGALIADENTWTVSSNNCTDWTQNIASGESGKSSAVNTDMIREAATPTTSCAGPESIYCVQQ